jgi:mRNA-degrading endonuclease YafQ of YafQ-DinJ toxin-antitoxin module
MFTLRRSNRFVRKLKKLLKHDAGLQAAFREALTQLATDPMNSKLRLHKVRDADGQLAFSSRVTGGLHIIWRYANDAVDVLDLLDVGGHSESKKVYR